MQSSERGGNFLKFGMDVSRDFCARNSLKMIVRSHQYWIEFPGYKIHHEGRVVTVMPPWTLTVHHMSRVTRHTSRVTCHTSHVTRHTSLVTHHLPRIPLNVASRCFPPQITAGPHATALLSCSWPRTPRARLSRRSRPFPHS